MARRKRSATRYPGLAKTVSCRRPVLSRVVVNLTNETTSLRARPSSREKEGPPMPCLLVFLILLFPRIALVLLFFFTGYIERAYHGIILPILGFCFLPLTTIVYAWMINNNVPT